MQYGNERPKRLGYPIQTEGQDVLLVAVHGHLVEEDFPHWGSCHPIFLTQRQGPVYRGREDALAVKKLMICLPAQIMTDPINWAYMRPLSLAFDDHSDYFVVSEVMNVQWRFKIQVSSVNLQKQGMIIICMKYRPVHSIILMTSCIDLTSHQESLSDMWFGNLPWVQGTCPN